MTASNLLRSQLSLPVVVADFVAVDRVNEDVSHYSRVTEVFVEMVGTEGS